MQDWIPIIFYVFAWHLSVLSSFLVFSYSFHYPSNLTEVSKEIKIQVVWLVEFVRLNF